MSLQIFKACLPQILLGPFLNTLIHLFLPSNLHKSIIFDVQFSIDYSAY